MNKKSKRQPSTYERICHEDPDFEKDLNKKYHEFVLSELLLAIMQEDHVSIRKLAKEAGVSPSLIQDLRSGKRDNLTLRSFSSLMDALGYNLILEKRKRLAGLPRRLRLNETKRKTDKKVTKKKVA